MKAAYQLILTSEHKWRQEEGTGFELIFTTMNDRSRVIDFSVSTQGMPIKPEDISDGRRGTFWWILKNLCCEAKLVVILRLFLSKPDVFFPILS